MTRRLDVAATPSRAIADRWMAALADLEAIHPGPGWWKSHPLRHRLIRRTREGLASGPVWVIQVPTDYEYDLASAEILAVERQRLPAGSRFRTLVDIHGWADQGRTVIPAGTTGTIARVIAGWADIRWDADPDRQTGTGSHWLERVDDPA